MNRLAHTLIFSLVLSNLILAQKVPSFYSYTVTPKTAEIRMYWKGSDGKPLQQLASLKDKVTKEGKRLLFAMNCGMFTAEYKPVGLYIEKGKQYSGVKKCSGGRANFCLQPQAVFYVTKTGKWGISTVQKFSAREVWYASQSAPMVVINGAINPALPKGLQLIRNGVGIRKDGGVVLAISAEPVNFHQFAQYFISQGCTTAMYFDGNVSAAYYKDRYVPYKGAFGAMIAVVNK